MRIVLVGAGNVAGCMAGALKEAGHELVCIYSRTGEHARALAESAGTQYVTDLSLLPDAEVFIVMLRDDALLQNASAIVSTHPDAVFLHTSGSVPLSVWQDAGARRYGVMYPLQTFSRGKRIDWSSVPLFIEADCAEDELVVRNLALTLSPVVTVLDSEHRCRMHLAAVFACNFSNRMYAICEALMKECDVPFEYMLPLITETAAKVAAMSPKDAQTGPAVRGDERVMAMHRDALDNSPVWREIYELVSDDIKNAYK